MNNERNSLNHLFQTVFYCLGITMAEEFKSRKYVCLNFPNHSYGGWSISYG